ncbi:rad2 superfamily protein mus201 isoform X2 [Lycorma delicatula]|uniref:rad2 superfamily protein mus201 isoform X2 n=1 Tax=Lycorma delicatula TaxID=130591 RepID=UPI003F5126CC
MIENTPVFYLITHFSKIYLDLGQFSNYQMNRLLKRRSVQVSLEEAEKEMGGHTFSLNDVEVLLAEQGVQTSDIGSRIASDNVTRYLFISDNNKGSSKEEENEKTNQIPTEDDNKSILKTNGEDVSVETKDTVGVKVELKSEKDIFSKNDRPLSDEEDFEKLPLHDEIKIESDSSSDEITFQELNEEFEMNRKLIIENSGITQEQILSIIKEQNRKSIDSICRSSDTENNEIRKIENEIQETSNDIIVIEDTKSKNKSVSNHNKDVFNEVCIKESVQKSTDDVIYNPESYQKLSVCSNVNNVSTANQSKTSALNLRSDSFSETTKMKQPVSESVTVEENKSHKRLIETSNSSNSGSHQDDNLIEVDATVKNVNFESEKNEGKSVLQVTISTKETISSNAEDDIFADVFDDLSHKEKSKISLLKPMNSSDVEFMTSADSSSESDNDNNDFENNINHDTMSDLKQKDDLDVTADKMVTCEYFNSSESNEMDEAKDINIGNSQIDWLQGDSTVGNCDSTIENNQLVDKSPSEIPKPAKKLTTKELTKLQTVLEHREEELLIKQAKEERLATTVTEQMRLEAQELLQLFGVPWVMAPMEAEAQCAFLDQIGLTQGTITDDSDIWLFGARKVYKNFFNQKKFVLQFQAQDIQHFFKLTRGDLIELALLVGSDYTVGITGVGPVTALEVISMFRPSSSNESSILTTLTAFKNWLQHPSNSNSPLAKKLKDVRLEEGFPSKDVVEAYLQPLVDESEEQFSWSTPDLDGLREFAKRKFGWNQTCTDKILLPVIKNVSQRSSQTTIDTFFQVKPTIPVYKDKVSHRVQKAIQRLGGERSDQSDLLEVPAGTSSSQRKTQGKKNIRSQIQQGLKRGRGARLIIEPSPPPKPLTAEELIPQREQDRLEALKRKMAAIEVLKTKKSKNVKKRPPRAPIKQEANLSESSSDEN